MREQIFSDLLDALPNPIYVFSVQPEGFILANQLFCGLIGYSQEELARMDWRRVIAADQVVLAEEALREGYDATEAVQWQFKDSMGNALPLWVMARLMPGFIRNDGSRVDAYWCAVIPSPKRMVQTAPEYMAQHRKGAA